ncbi:MAG: L-gulono,4-lactone dehydrogenase [Frankiaceae bacterium]|nr:L-gulono,4-lactone dehydrogenase [Frankiaceae bacterium]
MRHAARVPHWANWAGNQHAQPVRVETPRDTDEVVRAVKQAAAERLRVKAVGAGHSFTAIAATDGVQLRLDGLAGLRSVDRGSGLVTVGGGTPLHVLHGLLAAEGLAMSNLGDIDRQSISGAISTGTHGTGARLGGIATQVRGLELVTGDGSVLTCSPTENPAVFSAARVGLGALGIVTAVTLQCEPAFELRASERPLPVGDVMRDLDDLAAANEHVEFYWMPHTELALLKENNRPARGDTGRRLGRMRAWFDDEFVANTGFGLVCRVGRARPSLVPRLNRVVARAITPRTFTAPSYDVFVSPRRVRFVEMEYAVPRAAAGEAFAAIRDVIERERLEVSFPVEVRVAAGDDIPLSTGSGRDSAYFAIHMFRGAEFERYFRAVEARMRDLHGRPHWGKMHYRTAADLRPAYPRFDEFLAARDLVDPDRVFGNAYLETVLGP